MPVRVAVCEHGGGGASQRLKGATALLLRRITWVAVCAHGGREAKETAEVKRVLQHCCQATTCIYHGLQAWVAVRAHVEREGRDQMDTY